MIAQCLLRNASIALLAVALAACGGGDEPAPGNPGSTARPSTPAPAPTQINVSPTRLSLAPGQTARLTAVAVDNSGAPIAASVSWQSSDPAKVVIENNDTARGVAEGSATITAVSGSISSSPLPVRVVAPIASAGLIDAALAAGTIDATTALKYKVFAAYNDPRLPFEYLGNQRPRYESYLGQQLALAFPKLSEADQREMSPFMLPPIYEDSWLGQREAAAQAASDPSQSKAASNGRVRPLADARPVCSGRITRGWEKVDSEHFRVWFNQAKFPQDASAAATTVAFLEGAHAKLVALGMRPPVSDDDLDCNGGDGRFDFYLVESGTWGVGPDGNGSTVLGGAKPLESAGSTVPMFMVVMRALVGTNLFSGTVAHEYMHAVQSAYENKFNLPDEALTFLSDATADWAIDYLVDASDPGVNGEHSSAPGLLDHADTPLWAPTDSSLKNYGSYLFFQFVSRMRNAQGASYGGPEAIRDVWALIAAQPSDSPPNMLAALNGALPLGLTATWNDFSVAAWNQGPVDRFMQLDGLTQTAKVARTTSIEFGTGAGSGFRMTGSPAEYDWQVAGGWKPVWIQELSFRIERFLFPDDKVSTLTFFNGYTYGLRREAVGFADQRYNPPKTLMAGDTLLAYTPTAQERGGGRDLTALIKIGGQWTVENWRNTATRFFCRERNAEKIEELVLIYSNGAYTDTRGAELEGDNAIGPVPIVQYVGGVPADPAVLLPTEESKLVASEMPCHEMTGTATGRIAVSDGSNNFTVESRLSATLRGRPAGGTVQVNGRTATGLPGVMFETVAGTHSGSVNGVVAACRAAPLAFSSPFPGLPNASFSLNANYLPDAAAFGTYSGSGDALQLVASPASGCTVSSAAIELPAPNAYDFDALWYASTAESQFKVDLVNRRLQQSNVDGPAPYTGSYLGPFVNRSSWCFVATREGQAPPAGVCP